jgi:hypothetical protein
VLCGGWENYRPSGASCFDLSDCNKHLYALTPATIDRFASSRTSAFKPLKFDGCKSILQRVYAINWQQLLDGDDDSFEVREVTKNHHSKKFRRLSQKTRRWNRSPFQDKVQQARELLSIDAERSIRGHDLSDLLLHIIRYMRKDRKYGNSETLEGSLMASLECRDLERLPFFQRILSLATTP